MILHGDNLFKLICSDKAHFVNKNIEFVAQTSRTAPFQVGPDNIIYFLSHKTGMVELKKEKIEGEE